jgi:hypothetical protein
MAQALLSGQMANDMKANISTIKSMDTANSIGRTVENIKETGSTESSMEKEKLLCQVAIRRKESGRMAKD